MTSEGENARLKMTREISSRTKLGLLPAGRCGADDKKRFIETTNNKQDKAQSNAESKPMLTF